MAIAVGNTTPLQHLVRFSEEFIQRNPPSIDPQDRRPTEPELHAPSSYGVVNLTSLKNTKDPKQLPPLLYPLLVPLIPLGVKTQDLAQVLLNSEFQKEIVESYRTAFPMRKGSQMIIDKKPPSSWQEWLHLILGTYSSLDSASRTKSFRSVPVMKVAAIFDQSETDVDFAPAIMRSFLPETRIFLLGSTDGTGLNGYLERYLSVEEAQQKKKGEHDFTIVTQNQKTWNTWSAIACPSKRVIKNQLEGFLPSVLCKLILSFLSSQPLFCFNVRAFPKFSLPRTRSSPGAVGIGSSTQVQTVHAERLRPESMEVVETSAEMLMIYPLFLAPSESRKPENLIKIVEEEFEEIQ